MVYDSIYKCYIVYFKVLNSGKHTGKHKVVNKEDVLKDYAEGCSICSLASYYGCSRQHIHRIVRMATARDEIARSLNIELSHNKQEIEKVKTKLNLIEQVSAEIDKRMNNISGDKHNEKM